MTANVAGTFAAGANPAGLGDQQSGVLVVPTNASSFATLNARDFPGTTNQIRVQKSVDNGNTWSTVSNVTNNQTNVSIAVVAGEQYRVITVAINADTQVRYSLSVES